MHLLTTQVSVQIWYDVQSEPFNFYQNLHKQLFSAWILKKMKRFQSNIYPNVIQFTLFCLPLPWTCLTGRIQFFVIHVPYLSGVNSDPLRKAGHALMFSSLSLLFLKRKRKRRAEGPIHPSGVPGDVNPVRSWHVHLCS